MPAGEATIVSCEVHVRLPFGVPLAGVRRVLQRALEDALRAYQVPTEAVTVKTRLDLPGTDNKSTADVGLPGFAARGPRGVR